MWLVAFSSSLLSSCWQTQAPRWESWTCPGRSKSHVCLHLCDWSWLIHLGVAENIQPSPSWWVCCQGFFQHPLSSESASVEDLPGEGDRRPSTHRPNRIEAQIAQWTLSRQPFELCGSQGQISPNETNHGRGLTQGSFMFVPPFLAAGLKFWTFLFFGMTQALPNGQQWAISALLLEWCSFSCLNQLGLYVLRSSVVEYGMCFLFCCACGLSFAVEACLFKWVRQGMVGPLWMMFGKLAHHWSPILYYNELSFFVKGPHCCWAKMIARHGQDLKQKTTCTAVSAPVRSKIVLTWHGWTWHVLTLPGPLPRARQYRISPTAISLQRHSSAIDMVARRLQG